MAKCNGSPLCDFVKAAKSRPLSTFTHTQPAGKNKIKRKLMDKQKRQKKQQNTDCIQAGRAVRTLLLLLWKTPKKINRNTFKYATSESHVKPLDQRIHIALLTSLKHTLLLPIRLLLLLLLLLGNTVVTEVCPPYSKYVISWFRGKPIRHDLHLKTALITSKPQGMCFESGK